MQEEKFIKQDSNEIREIKLEPGIYDLTTSIKSYLENDVPIPDEEMNVLKTFDRENFFEKEIAEKGKEVMLSKLNEALKDFNFEEAKLATKEGIKMAQIINPEVEMKPFPTVFLFTPFGDAKSLHGQGCGINIGYLKSKRHSEEPIRQKIVTFTAHEAVHVFMRQLGVSPEGKNRNWEEFVWDFMWEEGLTTYVEPTHYFPHEVVEADGAYWVDTVNRWFSSDEIGKKEVFKEILERPSFQYWYEYMYNNRPLPYNWEATDKNFFKLLRNRNGLGYHIGSYLWKREVEKAKKEGKELKDLVMKGSDQMKEWMKGREV